MGLVSIYCDKMGCYVHYAARLSSVAAQWPKYNCYMQADMTSDV